MLPKKSYLLKKILNFVAVNKIFIKAKKNAAEIVNLLWLAALENALVVKSVRNVPVLLNQVNVVQPQTKLRKLHAVVRQQLRVQTCLVNKNLL